MGPKRLEADLRLDWRWRDCGPDSLPALLQTRARAYSLRGILGQHRQEPGCGRRTFAGLLEPFEAAARNSASSGERLCSVFAVAEVFPEHLSVIGENTHLNHNFVVGRWPDGTAGKCHRSRVSHFEFAKAN